MILTYKYMYIWNINITKAEKVDHERCQSKNPVENVNVDMLDFKS